MKVYVATFHGDIGELHPIVGNTLEDCLTMMRQIHGFGKAVTTDYGPEIRTPDPEDDKIEVWEYDNEALTARIVWGFWGWHWQIPEGLEQGTMPYHDRPLYTLAMAEY